MQEAISFKAPVRQRLWATIRRAYAGEQAPTMAEAGLAVMSATLLLFSFPDFNWWPLAWVGLAPLFVAIARRPQPTSAFLLGWLTATLFFYGSCYWLTYSPIHYGGIPAPIAYLLLLPLTVLVGLFPATCCLALARAVARWGARAVFVAPFLWTALEWARLVVTGQLWNAIGYSQAYIPGLIQAARWGGVYAVGFLILTVNAALAYLIIKRDKRAPLAAALTIGSVSLVLLVSNQGSRAVPDLPQSNSTLVIAVQPNVPMGTIKSTAEMEALTDIHVSLSEEALRQWGNERATPGAKHNFASRQHEVNNHEVDGVAGRDAAPPKNLDLPRVVIWPESPMNFTYAQDAMFREMLTRFTRENRTSLLFNSLEPAPANGAYNAAVMVNEEGRLIAQYDKIRLLPFGEYVPLPRWLPGVNLVPTMVGEFTPGADYPLMPMGQARAGVFICFESAFPSIAREFAANGADVLINITNDGWLGPTPVMRQHLANAVFRAVENNRPILRVTNTGITAYITGRGEVIDETRSFQPATRTWTVTPTASGKTFYTKHGDLFAGACAAISLLVFALTSLKSKVQRPKLGLRL